MRKPVCLLYVKMIYIHYESLEKRMIVLPVRDCRAKERAACIGRLTVCR